MHVMTCRNQLMNEGKPYPRSGCDICGSMFGRSRLVCTQGVLPAPGEDPKYYIPVEQPAEPQVENKYAVIYSETIHHPGDERSRTNPGHGYPAYDESVEVLKKFPDEDALKEWILNNNSPYGGGKSFKAIRYQELKASTEVKVHVG